MTDGAAQCCESDLQGVGLLLQQWWQLIHHPALSHHLHCFKRASQDGAGLLDRFIKSLPSCCRDAGAPAPQSHRNKSGVPPALQGPEQSSFLSRWSLLWPFLCGAAVWSVQSSLLFRWTPRYSQVTCVQELEVVLLAPGHEVPSFN